MDHAQTAFLGQGNSHRTLGHRVHRRADQRKIEANAPSQPGADLHLGWHNSRIPWNQQHIVKGDPGLHDFAFHTLSSLLRGSVETADYAGRAVEPATAE